MTKLSDDDLKGLVALRTARVRSASAPPIPMLPLGRLGELGLAPTQALAGVLMSDDYEITDHGMGELEIRYLFADRWPTTRFSRTGGRSHTVSRHSAYFCHALR
ncbi:MAG: hypothetical protein ACLQFT_14185 [Steroidobacteraceae bacterium]